MELSNNIEEAIHSVIGPKYAALHEPRFSGNEWNYLKECLDSTFVSSVGKFVDKFERGLEGFTGAKHAIAVVNGTAALHVALKLAGVINNDEVLIPTLTFVATANAVSYCGAVPHFVDSEEGALGIDAKRLRLHLKKISRLESGLCVNKATKRVIRAIVPMHTFGHPSDMDELIKIANEFNLILIEDAAESLGSFYKCRHTGTFGMLGALSFNGNKIITTGGGGAILTNDDFLAEQARHITTTAKLAHDWEYRHDAIGFNYRMPNLNAALGCAQLEQLPEKIASKRSLFMAYEDAIRKIKGVKLISEPLNCASNYWLQALLLDPEEQYRRDEILRHLNLKGYMSRPAWEPLHQLTPYKFCPRMDLFVASSLAKRLINIPSSSGLIK